MNRRSAIICPVLCTLYSVLNLCGCQNHQLYKDNRVMMGTFIEVISPDKRAADIAFREIKKIEDLLSKYNPDSEISRLNKTGELRVGPDTFYLMQKAREFWQASNGAFDVTIGPLMDLWGFSDKNYRLPDDKEVKKTLALVGFDKIFLDNSQNMVKFITSGMKIDLGGIAKGYALDKAADKLKAEGITSCLINAGGQV